MARPLAAPAIALLLILLPPLEPRSAETEIECAARKPAGAREYWSWREVDGRRCWYVGRPGLAKSLLRWGVGGVRVVPASEPGEVLEPDLSGTFVDRWWLVPPSLFNPNQIKDWK